MHGKYGPIVRINPQELHISDSTFMDEFYVSNKRDKWTWDLIPALDGSIFATGPQDLHRIRRSAVDPFFSTQNVRKLQPVIQELADKVVRRLREYQGTSEIVDAGAMFSSYSNDTVMEYAFGKSNKLLEIPHFDTHYRTSNREGAGLVQMLKHFRWVFFLIKALPEWLLEHNPDFKIVATQRNLFVDQILNTQKSIQSAEHLTIFHEILNSKLPASEKTPLRLAGEAQVVIGAGTETTAWNLTVAFYYLLAQPKVLLKLKEELKNAIPDRNITTPLVTLEHLPYLNGVIKETLRLSQGVTGNIPRITPKDTIHYRDWNIPANTPVSMSFLDIHSDETIFPDWKAFKPERWIDNPSLGKYLMAFSKGPRHCLGMNLAYAEIYILLSGIFRRFGSRDVVFDDDEGVLELYKTDLTDVTVVGQLFLPLVKQDSEGVRFRVLSKEE